MYQPDCQTAELLARQVRLPNAPRGATQLFGAASFALSGEEPLFSLFRPPQVARTESGEARLLVVTGTRVVEVQARVSGEWALQVSNDYGSDVEIRVEALSGFTRLEVRGGVWLHNEDNPASCVLDGSSATLSGVGESLPLWVKDDPCLDRVDADAVLRGLGILARTVGNVEATTT